MIDREMHLFFLCGIDLHRFFAHLSFFNLKGTLL